MTEPRYGLTTLCAHQRLVEVWFRPPRHWSCAAEPPDGAEAYHRSGYLMTTFDKISDGNAVLVPFRHVELCFSRECFSGVRLCLVALATCISS